MKTKRDAFLYFDNSKNEPNFAQCQSCAIMDDDFICGIYQYKVNLNDTCGNYIPGPRGSFAAAKLLSKTETGFLSKTQVRCENCFWTKDSPGKCGFFTTLNNALPNEFDLDTKINAKGCCNGWRTRAKN